MNAKTANQTTVVELRKYAASLGIKNVAKLTKAALQDEILTAEQAKVLQASKAKAPKAKAVKAPKVGAIVGGKRMSASAYEAAGIENEHNDGHHKDVQPADCQLCFRRDSGRAGTGGTSRAGMTMSVPGHASGAEKAAVVAEAFAKVGLKAKVATRSRVVSITVTFRDTETIVLAWDVEGAYRYDLSGIAGRKVRNVKAALRYVGVAA